MPILLRQDKRGFTLIELLTVILMLGVLSTIAISALFSMKEKAYISTIESDLSAAYKASVIYHTDDPSAIIPDLNTLKSYGYSQSENVTLNIVDGSVDFLELTATHPGVSGTYEVDESGKISEQ
jgi:prepilin-type N-terminal cleavage/methylation domain-containing protein